jgi:hypothetical protein
MRSSRKKTRSALGSNAQTSISRTRDQFGLAGGEPTLLPILAAIAALARTVSFSALADRTWLKPMSLLQSSLICLVVDFMVGRF